MNTRDPGLQPERTILSWNRTAYSIMLPALLCLRGWFHYGEGLYALSSLLLIACATGILIGKLRKHPALVSSIVTVSCFPLMYLILFR